ncbi:hypothetical protein WN55_09935 [Dufourea novaeangliae]|uniref:Uncharacterized protein n=1 Tax=Dufourea novaeangliae TaxID=178035 RepID=A0A154P7R7_DUFNO|nr:hypothetical protein WN55_09935 [Dufourea novaeangliae]
MNPQKLPGQLQITCKTFAVLKPSLYYIWIVTSRNPRKNTYTKPYFFHTTTSSKMYTNQNSAFSTNHKSIRCNTRLRIQPPDSTHSIVIENTSISQSKHT